MTASEFQAKYGIGFKRITEKNRFVGLNTLTLGAVVLTGNLGRTYLAEPWEFGEYEGDDLLEILERLCSMYRDAPSRPTAFRWYEKNPTLTGKYIEWEHGWAFLREFIGEQGRMDLLSLLDEKDPT